MDDYAIESDFDEETGELTLHCGREAFQRLRHLLVAEASALSALTMPPEEVAELRVVRAEPPPEASKEVEPLPGNATWGDCATACGCMAVMCALVVVFLIGAVTVGRWIIR